MRQAIEKMFTTWDGTELFYRAWPADTPNDRAIILFHRGHEHSGRWQDVIDKLNLPDHSLFAWDARGHGRSPGERGYAESFGALVKDVDSFVRHVSAEYGFAYENTVVMAHSVGSVLVSTWVHDYAPPIRALVLGSPALRVRLYVPFAVPGLRLLQKVKGKIFIKSYVKGKLLTRDPAKARSYNEDPLITPSIAVNILLGLRDAATRLIQDAAAITVPVLMLTSGGDWVVEQQPQRRFFEGLSSPRKEMHVFPGFLHDTFNEIDNHLPIGKARDFIEDVFAKPQRAPDLLGADRKGHTKDEFDRLRRPLPAVSIARFGFAVVRFLMSTAGRLSEGIRVGWHSGFDSGAMLDYVYRNEAKGLTSLGRWMDRQYLDSPGWRGIRQRKVHLEAMLEATINSIRSNGDEVRIVDIATGQGRYVLDVLARHRGQAITALLRDFSDANVRAGAALATEMGLAGVEFERGDAFDQESLARITSGPNIGIVSGLYELFPENAPVRRSLAGLAEALVPEGFLVYTGQPWHPQIEFIARVLTSHRGSEPWVMRRRAQAEMDALVAEAGFEKIATAVDEGGIFTVSLARKT
jgi:alpha-beta hydrolase superfamily lysophospholipase/SAM-dependent methyltransferase